VAEPEEANINHGEPANQNKQQHKKYRPVPGYKKQDKHRQQRI
jgi:hypothetical protein